MWRLHKSMLSLIELVNTAMTYYKRVLIGGHTLITYALTEGGSVSTKAYGFVQGGREGLKLYTYTVAYAMLYTGSPKKNTCALFLYL